MKIKVKSEGRKGVYICEKDDIIRWLEHCDLDVIHNYQPGPIMFGADWTKPQVIETITTSDRIGILTGSALANNRRHALSVITGGRLEIFDIGEITDDDLELGD